MCPHEGIDHTLKYAEDGEIPIGYSYSAECDTKRYYKGMSE